jgi:glycosyltransferase involved in cell wall biosynthesis
MVEQSPPITIAICTYNRSVLLAGAIESLSQQSCDPNLYQILVVDNASTDRTQDTIASSQQRYPDRNIIWIYEKKQGLSNARNYAWRSSHSTWIGFLDDDARAAPDYLEKVFALISHGCQYMCVGGPIYPFYTTNKPFWFKDIYESRVWGQQARLLNQGESLSGSNMIWRRESLELAGGFNENLGVRGMVLSIGEETDIFKRLWRQTRQPQFYYSPELIVRHWVPEEKLTVRYQLKRFYAIGRDTARLDMQPGIKWRLRTILRSSGAVILRTGRAVIRRYRYRYWQNWAIEEGRLVFPKLGLLAGLLGYQPIVNQRGE